MKQEFFVQKGELISNNEWINKIHGMRPDLELTDSEEVIATKLRKMVDEAIKERIEGKDAVAVCFSGGLDSSYIAAICKKEKANLTCYNVGFQDGNFKVPDDAIYAELIAKHLKLSNDEFKSKIFNLKEIEEIITKTTKILKAVNAFNVVTVGVGSVEVAAHSISKKEKVFFSGLGSEEIFAGYDRHRNNPTNDECYDGLLKMYERDLIRDSAIPKALKFSFTTPFLDEELIKYSLKIPIKYKIVGENTKVILRKAALPYLGKFADRPKKAAQYGSSMDRAILKLAEIHGYDKRLAWLESLK